MSRLTVARIAGVAFLLYIGIGIALMMFARQPAGGILRALSITSFAALVLGVTLYVLTREIGRELALFGLVCRVVEAVPGDGSLYFAVSSLVFSWLFLRGKLVPVPLALLGVVSSVMLVVCLPLWRAELLGGPMDWSSRVTWAVWLPMLVYEVVLGLWLIIRGVAEPRIHATGRAAVEVA